MACLFLLTLYNTNLIANPTGPWEFQPASKKAYHLTLQLKIKEARQILFNTQNNTIDFSSFYVSNLTEALELLITEDGSQFDKYETNWKRRAAIIEEQPKNPYKDFYLAEMHLQWAFVYVKFDSEFSAAWNLRQAYRLIGNNAKEYIDFLPNSKTLGLLQVLLGAIPDKYDWLLSIFGLRGSIADGLKKLEHCSQTASIFQLESDLMLQIVKAYVLQDKEGAANGLNRIISIHSDNPLIKFLYASTLIKNAQSQKALDLLNSLLVRRDGNDIPFHYLHYLRAEILMQKGDFDTAIKAYKYFLTHFKGANFVKSAYYKLALCHWLSGDQKTFFEYIEKAKKNGSKKVEHDKYAAKKIKYNDQPNRTILTIRLLTDGGFYDKAKKIIDSVNYGDFTTLKEQVEFIYRQARLNHKTNSIDLAKSQYNSVIEMSGKSPWYFAPNSALQLGYIHQNLGNPTLAKVNFSLALSYNNHEYKSSIDNKAKIALSTLEQQ